MFLVSHCGVVIWYYDLVYCVSFEVTYGEDGDFELLALGMFANTNMAKSWKQSYCNCTLKWTFRGLNTYLMERLY